MNFSLRVGVNGTISSSNRVQFVLVKQAIIFTDSDITVIGLAWVLLVRDLESTEKSEQGIARGVIRVAVGFEDAMGWSQG